MVLYFTCFKSKLRKLHTEREENKENTDIDRTL